MSKEGIVLGKLKGGGNVEVATDDDTGDEGGGGGEDGVGDGVNGNNE
jgi:hypothetical protein